MTKDLILAIDQGTTSSRAIVFDKHSNIVSVAQEEFAQIYPQEGWVEHDLEAIWATVMRTTKQAFDQAEARGGRVIAIGITNQRETVVIWNRKSGKAIHHAIVWQDRRTSAFCQSLIDDNQSELIQQKTGLLIDPYFSAAKIAWILDHVEGARKQAADGELAFGTIDSFLIARLTGHQVHATDASNASRTSLFNIRTQCWDQELMDLFNVPMEIMPKVLDSADNFGSTQKDLLGRSIAITGVAGDQQAAVIGQCCFKPGSLKSTYGTGCFVMVNTGETILKSRHKLLSTVAYRINDKPTYALEGSIFIAGAVIKWLRDSLNLISSAKETESLAVELQNNGGVYLVPAFTGLGAPYWNPNARASISGLTLGSDPAHIVRAALESVCYQTRDLFDAIADDGIDPQCLRVDGGMVANNWMLQFLSDILEMPLERSQIMETTALGAAYLAGLQVGMFDSFDQISTMWKCENRFEPTMPEFERTQLMNGWHEAVRRIVL